MTKITLFAIFTSIISLSSTAQVSVQEYPRSFSCDIDGINDLPPPVAVSPCGAVSVSFDDQIFSGGCLGTLVRSYTFKDECGNTESAEQYILLKDNLEPTIYGAPKDVKIKSKNEIPPAPTLASRDNSGENYEVILKEEMKDNSLTRTWTCTDACGNTATAIQVITFK